MAAAVAVLFLSGLFSCQCLGGQYHFVSEQLSWAEAQHYCRAHYSDLATIASLEDHIRFIKHVKGFNCSQSLWIGMHYNIDSWSWSLDGSALEETGYANWGSSEPNNKGENCTFMNKGKWGDARCTVELPYLCYNANNKAPSDYILMLDNKTWSDAQRYCREHHTDLASVRNQEENERLVNVMASKVYIGLFRDPWKWSDQSRSRFTAWLPTYPQNGQNAKCAYYQTRGWADSLCGEKRPFMCQSGPYRHIVRVTLQADATRVNMADAAVWDAMAQQIHQRLKAIGQPVSRVTWRPQRDGKVFHDIQKDSKKKREKTDNV